MSVAVGTQAGMAQCPNCLTQRMVQKDSTTNETVCMECNAVVEENRIVSDITFSETAAGKAIVTGQYVAGDQAGALGNSLYGVQSGESRRQTTEKAKFRLERIGRKLEIPEHIIDGGLRYFRIGLEKNFVKGRKSQHVLSACLYLSCRLNKTDHMLMDFSELLHVNVFNIGATYLQLVRCLKIDQLPVVDPTVFIQKFTAKLQFGLDGSRRVVNDAKLLVQRMGKDWLHQGRRPAGVAAACILLAARMNNFRRSKAEIVQVAKVAEETLQRRLDEFRNTPAGTLTIQDFRATNVASAADPPSFTRHRELERRMAEKKAQEEEQLARGEETEDIYLDKELEKLARELDEDDGETLELTHDVEDVLKIPQLQDAYKEMESWQAKKEAERKQARENKERKSRNNRDRGHDTEKEMDQDDEEEADVDEGEVISENEEDQIAEQFIAGQAGLSKQSRVSESNTSETGASGLASDKSGSMPDLFVASVKSAHKEELASQESNDGTQDTENESTQGTTQDTHTDTQSLRAKYTSSTNLNGQNSMGRAERYLLEFRKKRATRLAREASLRSSSGSRNADDSDAGSSDQEGEHEEDMDGSLSDIDDDEIESVLLTEHEIEIKTRVWMSINREYLIDQERKRLRQEADIASGVTKPSRKKRRTRTKKEPISSESAEASTVKMMKQRAQSKKINYAKFAEIFGTPKKQE